MQELAIILICYYLGVEIYCGVRIVSYIKNRRKAKNEAYRRLCRRDIEARLDIKRNREKLWKTVRK